MAVAEKSKRKRKAAESESTLILADMIAGYCRARQQSWQGAVGTDCVCTLEDGLELSIDGRRGVVPWSWLGAALSLTGAKLPEEIKRLPGAKAAPKKNAPGNASARKPAKAKKKS